MALPLSQKRKAERSMQQPQAVTPHHVGDIIESVITKGDLAKLTPQERVAYYKSVCDSVGLNPLTRPFEFITLNGRLVLYARRDAADQLRKIHGISVEVVSQQTDGDLFTVHVRAHDKTGRKDEDFGVVSITSLRGEARANAQLKAITKAKRRVTLSIAGLGFLDETEVDDIPGMRSTITPVNTIAELDQFAAEGGEVTQPDMLGKPADDYFRGDQLADAARSYALRGMAELDSFKKRCNKRQLEELRPLMAELEKAAKTADDPFHLEPLPQDMTHQPGDAEPEPAR